MWVCNCRTITCVLIFCLNLVVQSASRPAKHPTKALSNRGNTTTTPPRGVAAVCSQLKLIWHHEKKEAQNTEITIPLAQKKEKSDCNLVWGSSLLGLVQSHSHPPNVSSHFTFRQRQASPKCKCSTHNSMRKEM
eukprot:TRINITY_DN16356_c0_g1_i1.p1 TRINITY_DN16356_c0_g1~~TRINITY_DN16356_c0_g1_i1.p1  ORF type:complete len:134 (-),score=16.67 TRINITY_DN16356_c0_g1_i1:65-466(-)